MRSATSDKEQVDSAFGLIQDIATFGLLLVRRPRWLPIFGEWVTPRSQEALEEVLSDRFVPGWIVSHRQWVGFVV